MTDTSLARQDSSVSCDEAVRIAQADAENAYRNLSIYRIAISLEDEGWQVDYEPKDHNLQGGGPHYLIDSRTGEIISKRYDQ